MNILIVGSGAREHALVKTLIRTSPDTRIFCYGNSNNPGIRPLCQDYTIGSILSVDTFITKIPNSWITRISRIS